MKIHLAIPAVIALAVSAATPASVLAGTPQASRAPAFLEEPNHRVAASTQGFDCRVYANRWARERCDVVRGQPTPY
jgi:hypothetical protein